MAKNIVGETVWLYQIIGGVPGNPTGVEIVSARMTVGTAFSYGMHHVTL